MHAVMRLNRWTVKNVLSGWKHLEGDGADSLGHAHHELAQLGVLGGCNQELLEAVSHLQSA